MRDTDNPERPEEVYADLDRIRDELGWSPTVPLDAGLDEYLTWLRAELAREGAR